MSLFPSFWGEIMFMSAPLPDANTINPCEDHPIEEKINHRFDVSALSGPSPDEKFIWGIAVAVSGYIKDGLKAYKNKNPNKAKTDFQRAAYTLEDAIKAEIEPEMKEKAEAVYTKLGKQIERASISCGFTVRNDL
jgi:hypothetical protein